MSPRETLLQARPLPPLRGRPGGAVRAAWTGLGCSVNGAAETPGSSSHAVRPSYLSFGKRGHPGSRVREFKAAPIPGVLRNPIARPLPHFPLALPLIHPPTQSRDCSLGPAACSPRSWTSSYRRSRGPRVLRSRHLRPQLAPGLGVFSSPSSGGSGARVASGPSEARPSRAASVGQPGGASERPRLSCSKWAPTCGT